jgi:outer membrane protein OmpA-like peptidoglycan-associated protein/tetratricopeptide (TPR) repeat protein
MKKHLLFLTLTLLFSGHLTLFAQIRQANNLFNQFKYSKAISLYKKAVSDKNEKIREEATVRLADCYRLMNNAELASSWYNKTLQFNDVDPINYYYLGLSLQTMANYAEAEKAFLKYAEKVPSDFRGKTYAGYCNEIKKWEGFEPSAEIKNVISLNSVYSDFGPVFYKDGLIFTSDRDIDMMNDQNYLWTSFGYLDLYSSLPSTNNNFWNGMTAPVKLSNTFNQPYHDGPASFTSDFKEIYTTRTLKGKLKKDSTNIRTDFLKIFSANLSDEKKVIYKAFPFNSDNYSVGHPAISADGNKLIFSSNMPGGEGQSDLYISVRVNEKWQKPVNLGPEINTFGNEVFPFLANDSTLFFSSDGHVGYGGLDIYESKLVNGKWTTPWNLKLPINSPYDDFSIIFNKNLTDGFFSSNRPGGLGSDDIYAFRNYHRTPGVQVPAKPIEITPFISGLVRDKKTLTPLDSATVFLLNKDIGEILILKTNKDGYFKAPIAKGVTYIVKAMKSNYFDDCLSFNIPLDNSASEFKTPTDLLLDRYALNKTFVIQNIYYDLDKWFIRDDAKPSLDKLIGLLKQYPINVEIGSHTDSRASSKYNNQLSQKRAEAAVNYLISKGIDSRRLTFKGYGETQLINKCADGIPCTEAEHQANRRTEFKITSISSSVSRSVSIDLNLFESGNRLNIGKFNPDFFTNCSGSIPKTETSGVQPDPEPSRERAISNEPRQSSVPVDKKENTNSLISASHSGDEIWFAVQIAAASNPMKITSGNFKGEKGVQEKKIGVYHKYFLGHFQYMSEAVKEQKRLRAKFPGSFVVAFKGEQPISVGQAKKN